MSKKRGKKGLKHWQKSRRGRYAKAPMKMGSCFGKSMPYNGNVEALFKGHSEKLQKAAEIEEFIEKELTSSEKLSLYCETVADSKAITAAQKNTMRGIAGKEFENVTIFDKRGLARLYNKAMQE